MARTYEPYVDKLPHNQGPNDTPLNLTTYKKSTIDRFNAMFQSMDVTFLGAEFDNGTRSEPEFHFAPAVTKAYILFKKALKEDMGV